MKIVLFSHVINIGCGMEITHEQTNLLESSGLLDACTESHFNLHYDKSDYQWLIDRWSSKNVKFHTFDESYKDWYEATTILSIQDYVSKSNDEFYVCYIHHKGASHGPDAHHNWRRYMQYWNIEKWRDCVNKLDEGYDTCGASFLGNPPYPFYAGNFYWAKASYLRRCKRMERPPDVDFQPQFDGQPHHRFDWECWNGSGNPKAFDLHTGPENRWYWPPQLYRMD